MAVQAVVVFTINFRVCLVIALCGLNFEKNDVEVEYELDENLDHNTGDVIRECKE